jgi:hypothetical protein
MNRPTLLSALAVLAMSAPVHADDAGLLRCAQTSESAARLACFDALVAQARQRQAAGVVATPKPEEFGRAPKADASEMEVLESRIAGRFDGWRPGQRFTLANGQIWQVSDDSSGVGDAQDPLVRIRRAALGSYRMEVDGVTRSPRVKRVQ